METKLWLLEWDNGKWVNFFDINYSAALSEYYRILQDEAIRQEEMLNLTLRMLPLRS
jgi:hypothetical protein